MDYLDVGLGSAAIFGAATILTSAFNIFQTGTQLLIQMGTISAGLSLAFSAFRFLYQRQKDERKRSDEMIERLKPAIYGPLLIWAQDAQKQLNIQSKDEILSRPSSPPDLSLNVDYLAIVGERLKTNIETIISLYQCYHDLQMKVKEEYIEGLSSVAFKINPEWKKQDLKIDFYGEEGLLEISIPNLISWYNISSIRQLIEKSKSISLRYGSDPPQTKRDATEIVKKLSKPADLQSFEEFRVAKGKLREELRPFISELKDVLVKGEKDWRL